MKRTHLAQQLRDRTRPLGTNGWEVEWCSDLPKVEGTNFSDMDAATFVGIVCQTESAAMAKAKQVFPEDKLGAVRVTPVKWTDPIGEGLWPTFCWEAVGDSIEYTGE